MVLSQEISELIQKNSQYHKDGYFSKVKMGVYTETELAAASLAAVTGSWMKTGDSELTPYNIIGGYNHFLDVFRVIHIWYGNKIA